MIRLNHILKFRGAWSESRRQKCASNIFSFYRRTYGTPFAAGRSATVQYFGASCYYYDERSNRITRSRVAAKSHTLLASASLFHTKSERNLYPIRTSCL